MTTRARLAWHIEQARWHQERIVELSAGTVGSALPRKGPVPVDPFALPATFWGAKKKRRSPIAWTHPNSEE